MIFSQQHKDRHILRILSGQQIQYTDIIFWYKKGKTKLISHKLNFYKKICKRTDVWYFFEIQVTKWVEIQFIYYRLLFENSNIYELKFEPVFW